MSNENIADEQIVKNVLSGDHEEFREIISRYQNYIYSIGRRFFHNEDDSNDFTQEVFIRAYESLGSFKEKSPFRFWLMRIAYNYGINKKKVFVSESDVSKQSIVSEGITPEDSHIHDEVKTVLMKAVNELPEKFKICLDFYFFLGLSYKEISDITEIPVNTIKSNVLRAKNILRDHLRGTIAEEYHEL